VLGNADEWCQERNRLYRPAQKGLYIDQSRIEETVVDRHLRLVRGGAFQSDAAEARSAYRTAGLPTYESIYSGFRLAKTCE